MLNLITTTALADIQAIAKSKLLDKRFPVKFYKLLTVVGCPSSPNNQPTASMLFAVCAGINGDESTLDLVSPPICGGVSTIEAQEWCLDCIKIVRSQLF